MGLAASQARLLLLTARKSDLEYRAQQITNAEMILAMQTEQVAKEYSIKISNQALFFTDPSSQSETSICLTAQDIEGLLTGGVYKIQDYRDDTKGYEDMDEEDMKNCNALMLLEGIKSGKYQIVKVADGEPVNLNSNNGFYESYYTADDAEAEAEYERATASIQVKEKRLQNDLQQVETQQKACDTEIDSVKKVMEKNIERTFKVFS